MADGGEIWYIGLYSVEEYRTSEYESLARRTQVGTNLKGVRGDT